MTVSMEQRVAIARVLTDLMHNHKNTDEPFRHRRSTYHLNAGKNGAFEIIT
jgi:hypothetical protein